MGNFTITREKLCRTVWLFGSVHNGPYGEMTFAASGRVTTRHHPAEHSFRLEGDRLSFLNGAGGVTSMLEHDPLTGTFRPLDGLGHTLRPLLEIEAERGKGRSVFVNTLPKAGTYLLYAALERAGLHPLDLHVMDHFLHDNRGVPMGEIHFDPRSREHPVGASAIANVMTPGSFAVGHLEETAMLQAVAGAGVTLINVIREPRSMLLSFHTFRKAKVKPTPHDALWQSMEGLDSFKAFLLAQPIDRWLAQIETLASFGPYLRYEDVLAGQLPRKPLGMAMHRKLLRALPEVIGAPTATLIEGTRDAGHPWLNDPDVRAFFDATGVTEMSRRYWPELHAE